MSKKILVVPFILLAVGCKDRYEGQAGAASSPSPSPYGDAAGSYASPGAMSGSAGDMGGSITATVVSVDASGRTITVRDASASGSQGQRLNVSSAAAVSLSGLQPGDTVTITCDATGSMGAGSATTGTGTTGTTGTGTTGGSPGATGGTGYAGAGSGSLANCSNVTMITRASGAAGR